MTNHSFECLECKVKFSFSSEEESAQKFAKELGGIKCPKCGKVWGDNGSKIQQIIIPVASKIMTPEQLRARRKENSDRSFMASRQAAEFARENQEEMVSIGRPSRFGGATQYGKQSEQIPKSVIESLTQKGESFINQE